MNLIIHEVEEDEEKKEVEISVLRSMACYLPHVHINFTHGMNSKQIFTTDQSIKNDLVTLS